MADWAMPAPDAACPTLVLLPGMACDAALWQPLLPALAQACQAAGAPAPVVADVHTRADSVPAMATLLLAEHSGPLLLAGCSLGGMVGLHAALQAPQQVQGLALVGSGARADTPELVALRSAAIAEFEAGRAETVLRANALFAFHPQHQARLLEAYLAMVLRGGVPALVRQNRAVMARPDLRPQLPAIPCPVLVVHGEDDQIAAPENAREMAAAIPGAALHWLPACGHLPTWEQPEALAAVLRPWLAARWPAAAGPTAS